MFVSDFAAKPHMNIGQIATYTYPRKDFDKAAIHAPKDTIDNTSKYQCIGFAKTRAVNHHLDLPITQVTSRYGASCSGSTGVF